SARMQCKTAFPLRTKSGHSRLFDHLVRTRLHCRRDVNAKGFGGLEVDVQFDFCAALDRKPARFFAFENSSGIDTGQAVRAREAAAIAHQTAGSNELSVFEDGWHRVAHGQCSKLFLPGDEKRTAAYHEPIRPQLREVCEDRIEFTFAARIEDIKLNSDLTCRRLQICCLGNQRIGGRVRTETAAL